MRQCHRFAIAGGMLLVSSIGAYAQSAGRLDVAVSGLRNGNGVVRCALFTSPTGFREPGREFRGVVAPIRGGQAVCSFANLPAGQYAAAVFHAERGETRLETGMFGKPKQGFGFSRNPSSSFGPPSFADAAFDYRGGNQSMVVALTY